MKPYQYGMEPDVEMRVQTTPPLWYATADIKPTGEMVVKDAWVKPGKTTYCGWQWAIVHGTRLTASGSGKDEAEAYRETCDAFNLGLKLISEAN